MPYEENKYFETPCRSEPLWRYMSIDKFLTMLNEKSLYFPNITKFKDDEKYEGTLPPHTSSMVYSTHLFNENNTPIKQDDEFRRMKKRYEENMKNSRDIEGYSEYTRKEVTEQPQANGGYLYHEHSFDALLQNLSNHLMFCSSWFLRQNESNAMWAEYGDKRNPTSVAIQTTVGDLIDSLESACYQIHIGKVKYIDYKTDYIKSYENFLKKDLTDPNVVLKLFYAPILHKNDIYKDEDEIRAIISFEYICNRYFGRVYTSEIPYCSELLDKEGQPNIDNLNAIEKIEKGISIEVNLQILLKRIVVSPNFNRYFYQTFEKLLECYNIDPNIIGFSVI